MTTLHFHDTQQRRWTLSLSIGTVKRVRELTGFDLLTFADKPQLLAELAGDPVRFVDVLFAIVQPQADELGVTDVDFGEGFNGQAIEEATDAFLEAMAEFFSGARQTTFKRVVARAQGKARLAESELQKALDDGTIDRVIEESLNAATSSEILQPASAPSSAT